MSDTSDKRKFSLTDPLGQDNARLRRLNTPQIPLDKQRKEARMAKKRQAHKLISIGKARADIEEKLAGYSLKEIKELLAVFATQWHWRLYPVIEKHAPEHAKWYVYRKGYEGLERLPGLAPKVTAMARTVYDMYRQGTSGMTLAELIVNFSDLRIVDKKHKDYMSAVMRMLGFEYLYRARPFGIHKQVKLYSIPKHKDAYTFERFISEFTIKYVEFVRIHQLPPLIVNVEVNKPKSTVEDWI